MVIDDGNRVVRLSIVLLLLLNESFRLIVARSRLSLDDLVRAAIALCFMLVRSFVSRRRSAHYNRLRVRKDGEGDGGACQVGWRVKAFLGVSQCDAGHGESHLSFRR